LVDMCWGVAKTLEGCPAGIQVGPWATVDACAVGAQCFVMEAWWVRSDHSVDACVAHNECLTCCYGQTGWCVYGECLMVGPPICVW